MEFLLTVVLILCFVLFVFIVICAICVLIPEMLESINGFKEWIDEKRGDLDDKKDLF